MSNFSAGSLITYILDNMLKMKNNQLHRKIIILSGHDVTLVNTMRALDIIEQTTKKPDYTSTLHFELHQNPTLDNDLEVKVTMNAAV